MPGKRSYADGCAAAHALDLVGERWALLVVRELLLGPRRFTDLRAHLPGISPNVLTQRLGELERASVLCRRKLPPPAAAWVYELTTWGRELETVIVELGRWGARSPELPREVGLSVNSIILSFRTMFRPAAAKGLDARYELRFGEDVFSARVSTNRIELERGPSALPDAIIESDPGTLARLVYDGADLGAAVRAGDVRISGSKTAAKRFLGLFSLPEPAASNHELLAARNPRGRG